MKRVRPHLSLVLWYALILLAFGYCGQPVWAMIGDGIYELQHPKPLPGPRQCTGTAFVDGRWVTVTIAC